jgi:hypothetical protein
MMGWWTVAARRTTIVAALLAFTVTSTAAGQVKFVIGAGNVSCGAWTQSPNDTRMAWALGYLSRAAFEHPGDILEQPDVEALRGWISNYCAANPLDTLLTALRQLEFELVARDANRRRPQ